MADTDNDDVDVTDIRRAAVAARLVLAELTEDVDACEFAASEAGDCLDCWQSIAAQLVALVAEYIREARGQQRAVADTERYIAHLLEDAERYDEDDEHP